MIRAKIIPHPYAPPLRRRTPCSRVPALTPTTAVHSKARCGSPQSLFEQASSPSRNAWWQIRQLGSFGGWRLSDAHSWQMRTCPACK